MNSTLQKVCLLIAIHLFGLIQAQITAPQGPPGPKGVPGPTGAPGVQGPMGDMGQRGEIGQKGQPGPSGAIGAAGAAGAEGVMGAPGLVGEPGTTGIEGEMGAIGVEGERGEMGATGATGATGVIGLPGITGPQGDKGARGQVGVQGAPGNVGDKGSQGSTGIRGEYGVKGDVGPLGNPGLSLQEQDVDECTSQVSNQCDPLTTDCINLATGYTCMCKSGYKAINETTTRCKDINECSVTNGDCAGTCTNTDGSYRCACPEGTLITANMQCADQKECLKTDSSNVGVCGSNPNIYCVNIYGTHECVSSKPIEQELTTGRAPAAQALTVSLINNSWIIALITWLAIITFIAIIVLFWLIYVFRKMKNEREIRKQIALAHSHRAANYDSDDEEMAEGLAGSGAIDIDIPRLPRSQRGTMKGKPIGSVKGSKSYKGTRSSKPSSVSSSTGGELKTASVRQHRVATGERNAANRLSGVDTFY